MYALWLTFQKFFDREWQPVSDEEARRSRYYGLGGWLAIFYALMLLGAG
jgi:hypothetical protein